MDPDQALRQAREEANRFTEVFDRDDGDDDMLIETANNFVEHFLALDRWMTSGGFLPGVWKPSHALGRPRRLTDGLVLPGVVHGTRTAYNQGCRCIPCTGANRAGGAAYRAKKKENQDGHV